MKQVDIDPSQQCKFKDLESCLPQLTVHRKTKMKLIYTPNNSNGTFIFEGSNDDIASIVNALTPPAKPAKTAPEKPINPDNYKKISKPNTLTNSSHIFSNLKQEMAFLKSIYLFAPNPKTDSGRGAFVAKQILDNKVVNIAALTKKAKCTRDTVLKVVNRMRDAGAVVNITDTSVTLVSLPDGPYTPKKYTRTDKPAVQQSFDQIASIKSV